MNSLAVASLVYLATHFSSNTPLRARVVQRFGEGVWMGGYSIVALVTLAWMIQAWRTAEVVWIASPEPWTRTLAAVLMPVAFAFVVAGVTTPNPAGIGQARVLRRDSLVHGVLRITRHPLLWGIAIWGISHMLSNPDVASWWLFGSQVLLALAGAWGQDLRKSRDLGERWDAYVEVTSFVPFAAIITGRQTFPWERGLALRALAGIALYGVVGLAHTCLFGVAAWQG